MRSNQHIKPGLALALTLAAIGAPTAMARHHPTPTIAGHNAAASPVVRPNPDEQTAPTATANAGPRSVTVTHSGHVAPSSATPAPSNGGPCGDICSGHGYGAVSLPPTIVRVIAPKSGFDWADAGIGAAAAAALMLIGLGGAITIRKPRARA